MTLDVRTLPRPRDVLGEFGLYVHVPFCSHRCWYCDFNAYASLDHLADAYMRALATDVRRGFPDTLTLTSIFIGGGTPSLVDAASIAGVLDAVREDWVLSPNAEITIECNPESLTIEKLHTYLAAGINRVSIGVQSLDAQLLQTLGRQHDAATALNAIRLAREAGFTNISADLIYGTPGETDDQWRASLDGVLACEPTHVSAYGLTYEEGTPLDSWRKLGKVVPTPDDDMARRWHIANDRFAEAGLDRYEISNWGVPSRHNSLYWKCGEYLGVGAGAHSHLDARRSWTLRSPERYTSAVERGDSTIAGYEEIDVRTRATEVMILGLRRPEGVTRAMFRELVGEDLETVFPDALDNKLLSDDGETVRVVDPLLTNAAVIDFVN